MENLQPDVKLLAIDIDGTLLNKEKQITQRTRDAVRAAQEAGIIVTLATARRYHNTRPIAFELDIDIPLILCDGALIMQHPQEQVLHTHFLPVPLAQAIIPIMVENGVQPIIHRLHGNVEETWTGPETFDDVYAQAYLSRYPQHLHRLPYADYNEQQPTPVRIVAFTNEETIYKLIPLITPLPCTWSFIKEGSYGTAELAVLDAGCSKASGVRLLAESRGIPLEQVMAIGDNTNDIEMLQQVGWGVAMGQAPESVKDSADAITASNMEDGVAVAIERYALRRSATTASNSFKRAT